MAGRSKKAAKPVNRRSRSAAATSYDQWARRTLAADTDLAVGYMREVLERSDEPEELLLGLRRIAEAQGMSKVAEAVSAVEQVIDGGREQQPVLAVQPLDLQVELSGGDASNS